MVHAAQQGEVEKIVARGSNLTVHLRTQQEPLSSRIEESATIEEILREIEAMRTAPVTADEMTLARNALTLSLPLQFETAVQICGKVSRQRVFGLPDDYWKTYRSRIEAVTPEEVQEVCRRYLDPDRLTLLAVGDAATAAPTLNGFGPVDVRPAS